MIKTGTKQRGILLIVLSALFFAGMNIFIRAAGAVPTIQKSFFRNLIALAVSGIMLARDGSGFRPHQIRNLPYLLGRACFGTIGILANFYAVDHLVVSDASMLSKMSPFFAVLASFFVLKEKISLAQSITLAGAFAGALLIIKPSLNNMDLVPSLIGLLGGISAGIAYTLVRLLGRKGERGPYIIFFFSVFSCLIMLPKVVLDYYPMTPLQFSSLIATGLCATGGQFAITGAYQCAPAREISIYEYTQVLFAAIFGIIFLGDMPDLLSVFGYLIICSMAVLNFLHNNRLPLK